MYYTLLLYKGVSLPISSEKCLIIIPTYNEVDSVIVLLDSIFTQFPQVFVLVIDDSSPDGTFEAVLEAKLKYKNLDLVIRDSKLGLGSAYRTGFCYALENGFNFIIQMDADGSHQVTNLYSLIYAPSDIDLVVGSRYIPGGGVIGWNTKRKLISLFGNLFARFMLRLDVKDTTSGFKRISQRVYSKSDLLQSKTNGYAFQIEIVNLVHTLNLKCLEVPITFIDRRFGSSKMSNSIIFEAISSVFSWSFRKNFSFWFLGKVKKDFRL